MISRKLRQVERKPEYVKFEDSGEFEKCLQLLYEVLRQEKKKMTRRRARMSGPQAVPSPGAR